MIMDVIVRGKNVELTQALKDHAIRKIRKLEKYFEHQPITAQAVLTVEKDRQIIEVTIPIDGFLLRAEAETPDMYSSVDMVVDKLERQHRKFKTRRDRRYATQVRGMTHALAAQQDIVPHDGPSLVRRKRFPGKPMDLDEALMQMDLLGHDFFVFRNAESDAMNVLYRRKDGDYGLLEPQ